MLDELRKLPDSTISAVEALEEVRIRAVYCPVSSSLHIQSLAAKYSTILVESPLRIHVVKADLTPQLATLMPEIVDEVQSALSDEMPICKDWTAINANNVLLRVIARVSGRIFVGEETCRNEEWMGISIDYTNVAFAASFGIKKWHPQLRPFVYRFLSDYRRAVQLGIDAKRIIGPLVSRRIKAEAEGGKDYQKPNDSLQWLMDRATETERRDLDKMTREQLSLSLAAIHTTTMGVLQALNELAPRPEYIQPLREELRTVLNQNDGVFTKRTMEQLKKLDSFMKECNRMNPVTVASFRRKILRDVTLSDGTQLRAGTVLLAPSDAIAHDDKHLQSASTFDGFRWARMREEHSGLQAGREQYVAVSDKAMQFGYGRHACPGRFFAANEIKIILANLLLNYEIKMLDGAHERYPNQLWDSNLMPDRTKEFMFKRNQA
ncbi:cytochrome P450 [Rhizodiscina lignyota]|uniref:Cytochrome P450 n=1 Tax=Rhizodiscina lignyota TaxID=1504668 RepID=A0A9P4IE15_9PEZI|nr:cytochrome P450 [Rhizodiscina lignyota]